MQKHACRLASDGSFAAATENLRELLGVSVGIETLRTVAEEHGRRMSAWQAKDDATARSFRAASGTVEFTVDAGKANTREDGWKDLKIGVFQKREAGEAVACEAFAQQRLPAATARIAFADIAVSKQFCQSWRGWAKRLGVTAMAELQVLADGASWIWKSVDRVFTGSQQTLDVFHACEHLSRAADALYGEGTAESRVAFEQGRLCLLKEGWTGVCGWIGESLAKAGTPEQRRVLERLTGYFAKHASRLGYASRLASGQPIGSGVVEGQAKTLGLRLKARGARWRKANVRRMASLVCVRHSEQWENYWQTAA